MLRFVGHRSRLRRMPGCRRNVAACPARRRSARRAPTRPVADGFLGGEREATTPCDVGEARSELHRQAVDRPAMSRTGCARRVRSRPPTRFAVHGRHRVRRAGDRTAWHRWGGAVRADRLRAPSGSRCRRSASAERGEHLCKRGRLTATGMVVDRLVQCAQPRGGVRRRVGLAKRVAPAVQPGQQVDPAANANLRCGQRAQRSGCARAG